MATQLRIKRGTTNANAPSGLTAGEMAINLVDKKLYVGGTGGTNVIFLDSTSSVGLGTANTFTALQTFSAGISASGATFTSPIQIPINTSPAIKIGTHATKNLTLGSIGGIGEIVQTGNAQARLNIRQASGGGVSIGDYDGANNGTYINVDDVSATITLTKDININGVAAGIGAGTNNTKFGKDAQSEMEAGGAFCSAFGYQAGYWNSTGYGNSSFGYNALLNTRTGSWNTGLGINSLYTNQSGLHNVSCGLESLYSQTSDQSVGIGSNAGYSINSSNVVAIGYAAAKFQSDGTTPLTGGSSSVYIGSQCRGLNNSDSNSIVIGASAIGFGVNTTVIGTSSTTSANIYGVLNLPSGLSAAGATFTGNISAPNIVSSFNGATGAVTGITAGGVNTFTALNTFSAGISASGATLSGTVITSEKVNAITSARTVTVNFQNGNIQTLTGLGSGATGSSAIGFTGASATGSSTVTMIITNGGLMTSNTTFWSTAVKWPGGFKTTLSTSGVDILTFTTIDAGTNIYGMLGGKAFS